MNWKAEMSLAFTGILLEHDILQVADREAALRFAKMQVASTYARKRHEAAGLRTTICIMPEDRENAERDFES